MTGLKETVLARLTKRFDCVVMLTWSNWFTEPRSNRYHFATRFARYFPVLFVQTTGTNDSSLLSVRPSGSENIDVIELQGNENQQSLNELVALLRMRGLKRPLLWIYNSVSYKSFLDSVPNALRVYHATEDYLTPSDAWDVSQHEVAIKIRDSVVQLLPKIDLLVAVSSAVADSHRRLGQYKGRLIVAPNGCDAPFFRRVADSVAGKAGLGDRPIAIFQGGINRRLDFDLLHGLVHILPNWDFWFCGLADDKLEAWGFLLSHPNVRHFGPMLPEALAEMMCNATVGLIPFRQIPLMQNSLPLKAYEYVACGLPVVTVPISALGEVSGHFAVAHTPEEFAHAMESAAAKRNDPERLASCLQLADANSYDGRFNEVAGAILDVTELLAARPRKLNILILYDDRWSHIRTVLEHVEAFRKYSRHQIFLLPASGAPVPEVDLALFDVVIHHYAVRVSLPDYLNEPLAQRLSEYAGLKILFVQDEYDFTETARKWIERLKFDIVYTCVPAEGREYVYPSHRFPWVEFLPTLTGYVPEVDDLDMFVMPINERNNRIGYRGRTLPYFYGRLGYEKYRIGVDVRSLAQDRGVAVDIEVDDLKRIYGPDWYRFIGSVRATLGTESGTNVFDFDGSISAAVAARLKERPDATFEDVFESILAPHEGHIRMNQVSPKIFEAIRLRTALVLFEGSYSGVVKPDAHYIVLKKDYSNIDEVFERLEDIPFLKALTTRAYDDVIKSGQYSYRAFVKGVDADIEARLLRGAWYTLYATPVIARSPTGDVKVVMPTGALGYALSTEMLYGPFQREQLAELLLSVPARPTTCVTEQREVRESGATETMFDSTSEAVEPAVRASLKKRAARIVWRTIPLELRTRIRVSALRMVERARLPDTWLLDRRRSTPERYVRATWRAVPSAVRHRVLNALRRG